MTSTESVMNVEKNGTLPIKKALVHIMEKVHEGHFDFHWTEKWFAIPTATISSLYLAVVSSLLYIDIGGEGTQYLPIGNFSKKEGGISSFSCNAFLNCYYILDTLNELRTAYKNYQLNKMLDVRVSLQKATFKAFLSLVLSSATSFIFYALSEDAAENNIEHHLGIDHTTVNLTTFFVNLLLNFLGTMALITFPIVAYKKLHNLFCDSTPLEDRITKKITDHIEEKESRISTLNPDAAARLDAEEYIDILFTEQEIDALFVSDAPGNDANSSLLGHPSEKTDPSWSEYITLSNCAKIATHIIMQACDKIALYGYYRHTVSAVAEKFNIRNPSSQWGWGSLIFLPFLGLSYKFVLSTTQLMITTLSTGCEKTLHFLQHPQWTHDTWKALSIITVSGVCIMGCILLSYISSNTSLELNAEYGWTNSITTWSTISGVTAFNLCALLGFTMIVSTAALEYLVYEPPIRTALNHYRIFKGYMKNHPETVLKVAEKILEEKISEEDGLLLETLQF